MPRRRCSSSNPDPTLSLTPTLTPTLTLTLSPSQALLLVEPRPPALTLTLTLTPTLTLTLSPSQALLLVCLLSDLARDGAMQVRVRDRVRN
jgi:hypothetical protein